MAAAGSADDLDSIEDDDDDLVDDVDVLP